MEVSPYPFALIILCLWPLVSLWLYRIWPTNQATLWTILGAQFLLPPAAAIKIPMLPVIDKQSIACLSILLGCVLFAKRTTINIKRSKFALVLILALLVSPVITSLLNDDDIYIGGRILPGVGLYDAGSALIAQLVALIPFFLARKYMVSASDPELIVRAILIFILAYSLPMLYEIRFSPQLNRLVYGYHASDFIQQMRDGSYRPTVFMGHGLMLSLFTTTSILCAIAVLKTSNFISYISPKFSFIYVFTLLILSKSAGALIYALSLTPVLYLTKPRFQTRVAVLIVSVAILYPVLRMADLVPTNTLLNAAYSLNAERANSLKVRLDNEEILLDHASKRVWFGWGRFGRNRVYNERGQDISITDGGWIIVLGTLGLFGFGAFFGLLALPVVLTAKVIKHIGSRQEAVYMSTLALTLAIWIFDLLPNSGLVPWLWLLAGAMLGRAEALRTVGKAGLASSMATMPPNRRSNLFKTVS